MVYTNLKKQNTYNTALASRNTVSMGVISNSLYIRNFLRVFATYAHMVQILLL